MILSVGKALVSLLAVVEAARVGVSPTTQPPPTFSFAVIGDQQYNRRDEELFAGLRANLDSARMEFVVHVGDINGGNACTDSLFRVRRSAFEAFETPFVFLFGDNEWYDCGFRGGARFDPLERLTALRSVFAAGDSSLGRRRIRLERQSSAEPGGIPENVRWTHLGVVFVGFNIPGGDGGALGER